jgi:putative alpha-1,2-mannosidase
MYNYVGKPFKAAPLLRQVMKEMYTTANDGLCGNEDVGQMSAWYVLSAIGLYQVDPAGGPFVIGSPVVNKATVQLENGKTFTVEAQNNSDTNIYVQSALLNGKPLNRSFITYGQLMQGGKLTLVMGSKPSKWATGKNQRP